MKKDFVHLHVHSEYSLLDGAIRIESKEDSSFLKKIKETGMKSIALTDHGVMYGILHFYQIMKEAGIKPIIGIEAYLAEENRFDKTKGRGDSPYHLILLAENNEGYKNLMSLCTRGFTEGFYYKPRIDREILSQYSQGLIALSGCLKGEISRKIFENQIEKAKEAAQTYQDIFGKGNFFLEIQNHSLEEQKVINRQLLILSKELKIPLVATNDVHYVNREDSFTQDVLLCIQTGRAISDKDRLKLSTNEFYLKSPQEMMELFDSLPEALSLTNEIAERCQVEIEFNQSHLPHYKVLEGYTPDSYLEYLCEKNFSSLYPQAGEEIKKRLKYELETIQKKGLSSYLLIVWDFVQYAKLKGIRVGAGRGSAAGSIVCYILGITNINPLEYDLLFERFLQPDRPSMPDIDIDFDEKRRDEVIDYVSSKYGEDNVAKIITFSKIKARAAVRDAARVLGFDYSEGDRIAKMIPLDIGVRVKEEGIKEALSRVPELLEDYQNNEVTKSIIDTASSIEGFVRQDSIHAAGVVVGDRPLTEYAPLQRKPDSETVIQYDMDAVKDIGLLKVDFLGLRNLWVIEQTLNIIKQKRKIEINIENLPPRDEKTFAMLRKGESAGVFQLESPGMRNLLKELEPSRIEDIVACVALHRPGPLRSGMMRDFIDYKHGRRKVDYLHPSLEPILKETYGIIVYQEQVMRIAQSLADFTMSEADELRHAMSKKKRDVMEKYREKFINGAKNKGINDKEAERIFDLVGHFAGYGFNKSHSAGYAKIAYQTAYLKANFPHEYMSALLTSEIGNKDKIVQYVQESRRIGIEVVPPNINTSEVEFVIKGKNIIFSLAAIQNIGESVAQAVVDARREGPYTSIFDFSRRVDAKVLNKKAIESLIKSGCFDSLGEPRKYLLEIFPQAVEMGLKEQKDREIGQVSLFGDREEPSYSANREKEITKEEFSKDTLLSFERELLGLYMSDNPLKEMEGLLEKETEMKIVDLHQVNDGEVRVIGGFVGKKIPRITKRHERMLIISLEDTTGSVDILVFPNVYYKYAEILEKEGAFIVVKGRIDKREDGISIIAMEVKELVRGAKQEIKKRHRLVRIRVPMVKANKELMKKLMFIFKNYHGLYPVIIEIKNEGKCTNLKLGGGWRVNLSGSFCAEIRELLGKDALSIKEM